MKVLVLTTSGRVSRHDIAAVRAVFRESVQVSVVGLFPPAERLRVRRFLVVGRSLRPRRALRDARVLAPRGVAVTPLRRPGSWGRRVDTVAARAIPEKWWSDNSLRLATGCVWSPLVRQEFRRADMVIALDWNATWAAWLLARRISGPHVVHTADGAALKLAELEALSG
ncbi:MAG: hypothetical protein JWM84_3915 [Nocardioides sp.]|nr:hypothetical protein [Nocardioides sp.]